MLSTNIPRTVLWLSTVTEVVMMIEWFGRVVDPTLLTTLLYITRPPMGRTTSVLRTNIPRTVGSSTVTEVVKIIEWFGRVVGPTLPTALLYITPRGGHLPRTVLVMTEWFGLVVSS